MTLPSPLPALRDALTTGGAAGTLALLGDVDPVALVTGLAAELARPLAWVDARELPTTTEFDPMLRGHFDGDGWTLGLLSRCFVDGTVFLVTYAEALRDDLRQRLARMVHTRSVLLRAPVPADDVLIEAQPEATVILHVDDHQPLLLQLAQLVRTVPTRIRNDRGEPPPITRRIT